MPRKHLLLVAALGSLAWLAVAALALFWSSDWWLAAIESVTIFVWLTLLLAALYQQGARRAMALGAAICAFTYWLLALGPWFQANVGPTLLSSRILAAADAALHPNPPAGQVWQSYPAMPLVVPSYANSPYQAGSSVITNGGSPATTLAFVQSSLAIVSGGAPFQAIGHWLLIWMSGLAGGLVALLMHRRKENANAASASPPASPTRDPEAIP